MESKVNSREFCAQVFIAIYSIYCLIFWKRSYHVYSIPSWHYVYGCLVGRFRLHTMFHAKFPVRVKSRLLYVYIIFRNTSDETKIKYRSKMWRIYFLTSFHKILYYASIDMHYLVQRKVYLIFLDGQSSQHIVSYHFTIRRTCKKMSVDMSPFVSINVFKTEILTNLQFHLSLLLPPMSIAYIYINWYGQFAADLIRYTFIITEARIYTLASEQNVETQIKSNISNGYVPIMRQTC